MIWFTLALFVISFVVTALLTPKPEFENARADTLNPDNFPRATENAPIPLVLGKVLMKAPNTLWYGDLLTAPITKKVKTGLFSSTRVTTGHQYFIGLNLGLALGPSVGLREVFIDDKSVWTGTTHPTIPTNIMITALDAFGGYENGGGWQSSGLFYPGSFNQTPNAFMEDSVGIGNVPAYNGTAHIIFQAFMSQDTIDSAPGLSGLLLAILTNFSGGSAPIASKNGAYIGESASLRSMAFVLECYTNALGLPNDGKIGEDMNPAEAIYQIMTNDWRGMGVSPDEIDLVQLQTIGQTLFEEGNGCSILVTAESSGKTLIQEVLRQIDGVAYQDPASGKIRFILIRNDYDPLTLPVYDEDDVISVNTFSRSGWDEVVAQVKITFPQRDSDSSAVAISQDIATVSMIGHLRSTTLSMPFVYDKVVANNIASRERSQLSVPLFRMTLEMNRNAHSLRPGSVFKLNWPEYNFSNLVLRVQDFDLGSLLEGKIVINCLQDSFALGTTVFAPPADTTWTLPTIRPTSILVKEMIEMPKFFAQQLDIPIPDGEVGVIPFAGKPSTVSNTYDMLSGLTSYDMDNAEPELVPYTGFGYLSAQYPMTAGFANGYDTVTGLTVAGAGNSIFTPNTLYEITQGLYGGLLYCGGEWMGFTAASDEGSGNWRLTNIYRGLLGTRPRTHEVNTRVWELNIRMLDQRLLEPLTEDGTLYYQLLDRAGPILQDPLEVVEASFLANKYIQNRPVRPAYITIGGARTGINITTKTNAVLAGRTRNRAAPFIRIETDLAETPDQAEYYDVDIMIAGVRNATLSGVNVALPYTIPFSATTITQANCEARVYSQRSSGNTRNSSDYAVLPFSMAQV